MAFDQKKYLSEYFKEVRATKREGHEDCGNQSCCVDGLRNYKRDKMRLYRERDSMPIDLTPTMAVAAVTAQANGGKLLRAKSGYWTVPGCASFFDHHLITDMVKLGVAKFTKVRVYRGKRSPKEVTIALGARPKSDGLSGAQRLSGVSPANT